MKNNLIDDDVFELFCPECKDLYEVPVRGNLRWSYGRFIQSCPGHWVEKMYGNKELDKKDKL